MIVVVHVIAGAAIAHVAATALRPTSQRPEPRRPGVPLVGFAGIVGLVSHGVLDGLRHGYPITALPDIALAAALAVAWCVAVRRPLRLAFALVIGAALLPDVVDHGADMLRWKAGVSVPRNRGPIFPWHWPEGSGSWTAGNLDLDRNRAVSFTNYAVVLVLASGGVLTSLWAFRFAPLPQEARREVLP